MTPGERARATDFVRQWVCDGSDEEMEPSVVAFATALREAEARGMERAIQAINNHPVQYHADTTLHSNVASVVAQCLAAIRAEKERTP